MFLFCTPYASVLYGKWGLQRQREEGNTHCDIEEAPLKHEVDARNALVLGFAEVGTQRRVFRVSFVLARSLGQIKRVIEIVSEFFSTNNTRGSGSEEIEPGCFGSEAGGVSRNSESVPKGRG
ncbi:hypothetical protein VNO78_02786 [Psophocarpus tetragonolobus]|uniref:Uncharacterized protein n=1 Tax=Psophocarpus tetragonolobus TaxID=3891 RepID=A0AAN9T0E7_PSOTE